MAAKNAGDRGRRPVHPGEILRQDVLPALDMNVTELATALGVTRKTLSMLLNERQGVSAEMAVRLGRAFEQNPQFWLNLQSRYDLWHAPDVDVQPIRTRRVA